MLAGQRQHLLPATSLIASRQSPALEPAQARPKRGARTAAQLSCSTAAASARGASWAAQLRERVGSQLASAKRGTARSGGGRTGASSGNLRLRQARSWAAPQMGSAGQQWAARASAACLQRLLRPLKSTPRAMHRPKSQQKTSLFRMAALHIGWQQAPAALLRESCLLPVPITAQLMQVSRLCLKVDRAP